MTPFTVNGRPECYQGATAWQSTPTQPIEQGRTSLKEGPRRPSRKSFQEGPTSAWTAADLCNSSGADASNFTSANTTNSTLPQVSSNLYRFSFVSFVFGRAAATLGRTTWSQTNSRDVADSYLKKIELGHNWAKTATWHDMVAGRNFGPHGTT